MKIRTRFTLLFVLIVGVMLSSFSFAIYYLSENHRQEDFHSRLKTRAIEKCELAMNYDGETRQLPSNSTEKNSLHALINENIAVYNMSNELLYRDNPDLLPGSETLNIIKKQETYAWSEKNAEGIGFIYSYQGSDYILLASAFDQHGMSYINNLRNILTVRLFIIMLIVFISGWLFSGYFIKPITNLVNQAENITAKNLSYRLKSKHVKDEIGKLTSAFNKMLDRLETAFTIQKRFVSNASHELRNPLTAIGGQVDVALMKDRKKEEYRNTLEFTSTRIKDLSTLVNNLLELANNDVDTLFQNFDEVRIDEILWNTRDKILKQKPECNIAINFEKTIDNEKKLTCKGKAQLLETAFVNIVDNACKFSDNKTVEIKVVPEKKNIVLSFTDSGIGIPETHLENIFEPFNRADNTNGIPGKGIGLSLVRSIIKLHSGKIFMRSTINKGTTVEIVLPNLS